jgi:hypothetical protein
MNVALDALRRKAESDAREPDGKGELSSVPVHPFAADVQDLGGLHDGEQAIFIRQRRESVVADMSVAWRAASAPCRAPG